MDSLDGRLNGRKRKIKFDHIELKVLVEEANKHIVELQQRNINLTKRNAIWESISEKVNAVGKVKRSTEEIKRRWQDARRRTKEKLVYNKSSANKTGGGTVDEIPLTNIEQQVQLTFSDEQVTGISEYDTLELVVKQEHEASSSEFQQSPPQSPIQPSPQSSSTEPQLQEHFYEDVGHKEVLREQRQSAALSEGSPSIAHEVRALASLVQGIRQDTHVVATHTEQLAGAVSGLALAINSLARSIQDGVQAVVRSLSPAGPQAEEREEQLRPEEAGKRSNTRKRKAPMNGGVWAKRGK